MPKPWYTTSHEQFLGKGISILEYLEVTDRSRPFHYSYAVEKQVSNTNNDTRTCGPPHAHRGRGGGPPHAHGGRGG